MTATPNQPEAAGESRYGGARVNELADPANWEIWSAPANHAEVLYQTFPEFTCLCPRSDYPDFATVHMVTVPNQKVIELKHLKLWFNSFRERRISHELATAEIVETLSSVLDLHYIFVLMDYTPRGNLTTIPMVEHQHPRTHSLPATDSLTHALANAHYLKHRLIDRIMSR